MNMREHCKQTYGFIVPDEDVITDTEEEFVYKTPSGQIVGWNRCEFTFWRNRDASNDPLD